MARARRAAKGIGRQLKFATELQCNQLCRVQPPNPLLSATIPNRLLIDTLGVKSGQRVAVLGVDGAEFLMGLAAQVPQYSRGKPIKDADLIFFSAKARDDLSRLKSLVKSISRNGAIWVVYPKGQNHIREIDVIAAGKSAGLTDNKVCRFSNTHTALRFVIPLSMR